MENILSPNDARIRLLKQKAAAISAALVSGNHHAEYNVFQQQYNWPLLERSLTARAADTTKRALNIWYQDFVS